MIYVFIYKSFYTKSLVLKLFGRTIQASLLTLPTAGNKSIYLFTESVGPERLDMNDRLTLHSY